MSTTIVILWWLTLCVAVFLVGPIAFYALNRTFKSAGDVGVYTAETLRAARGIAANLAGAEMLHDTAKLAARARSAAARLVEDARQIEGATRK